MTGRRAAVDRAERSYNRVMGESRVWGITLTTEMARQVREWRAEGCSYRAIAALADQTWGSDSGGNQLFGENPNAEPWN
jgi:hypothetical protein